MKVEYPFIIDIAHVKEEDAIDIGNKALNLNILLKNNYSIPDGHVIKTSGYKLFLNHNGLDKLIQKSLETIDYNNYSSIVEISELIRRKILESPLPDELIDELSVNHNIYNNFSFAVRSSATAEDLPESSFAGQYDTFLNIIGPKNITLNIKKCYASLWTERAISYREKNKIPHNSVNIAVLIQKMIEVKSAGVLFTANPITNNSTEFLIESNFGLGESLVSGQINPDQYIVQNFIKKGKERFKIISKKIGNKLYATYPKDRHKESGVNSVPLDEHKRAETSLSDDIIFKLAKIGGAVENLFGNKPQDIEWAINSDDQIWLLQTRPITTLENKTEDHEVPWSRGYSDDYWNDPVTPLFFDLLGNHLTNIVNIELNSIMGYTNMDKKLLKLHNGHVYFNLKVLRQKVENEIPSIMRNEDILNYFPTGYGHYGKETIRNLPFHTKSRVIAELRIMFHDPDGSITKTAKKYEEWATETFTPFCNKFDKLTETEIKRDDFLSLIEQIDRIMITHFRLVRYGIAVHNIGMNLLTQYLLTRFLGEEATHRYYPILISGLKHKLTETNDEVFLLASVIQKTPALKSLVEDNPSEDIYNLLVAHKDDSIQNFLTELNKFLKNFGDRGFTREPFYPRWKDKPMIHIFNILKSLVMDDGHNQERKNLPNQNYRKKIENIVTSKIRALRFGFIKWKIFNTILKISRVYIIFRENQRFILDRWITRNRTVYLKIGKLLKNEGFLKEEDDVFFLKKKEVENVLRNKYKDEEILKMKAEVNKRKDEFLKFENELPPKFLLGSHEYNDVRKFSKDSLSFRGIPASQGVFTGKIHIINTIDQISTVQTSEILVVPRTDPGWTPIFSKIGGLITETGGILSHGAVVSREYGIPAVTNIPNACKLFFDNQIVTINGYDGTITIKK